MNIYEDIERRFVLPSIHNIALTYCVTTTLFYNIVHSCEITPLVFGPKIEMDKITPILEDEFKYVRNDETRKSFLRLSSIIEKLSLGDGQTKGKKGRDKQEKLLVPTVFGRVTDLMLSEYNIFMESKGRAGLPDEYVKYLSYRRLMAHVEDKKESGFSFFEAVALATLYLSHKGRSVSKLNEPIKTDNERKRARQRFKLIKEQLTSKQLYDAMVRIFVDLATEWCIGSYKFIEEEHIREFHLPEEYWQTKDLRYAIKHHWVEIDNDTVDDSEWSDAKVERFRVQLEELGDAQLYVECILPLVELILTGIIPDDITTVMSEIDLQPYILATEKYKKIEKEYLLKLDQYRVPREDYMIACLAAETIDTYIQSAFKSAKELFSELAEADALDHRPFKEYFDNL